MARTSYGNPLRMLNIIDEYTRECLCIKVARKITAQEVLEVLLDLIVEKGLPDHIRSDNGQEFTAKAVRDWLQRIGVKTLFIDPGSPWENGYIESFNGKFRDALLNGEIFTTLLEARVLVEHWRCEYDHIRPHSSLGYRPPAPQAISTIHPGWQAPSLESERLTQGLVYYLGQVIRRRLLIQNYLSIIT
jgi:transposase InsO family protein